MTGSTTAPDGFRRQVPTLLTALRIALTLPVALFIVMDTAWAGIAAFVLFIAAAALDYFDGKLARAWNAVTEFGRALDPVADKVLVAGVLLALAVDGLLLASLLLPAVVIVGRDFLICGMREFAADQRRTLHVSKLAKWKTTAELAAIGFLLAAPGLGPLTGAAAPGLFRTGAVLLWIAAALSAWTGAAYVKSVLPAPKGRGPVDYD